MREKDWYEHYHNNFKNDLKVLSNMNKILPESIDNYLKTFKEKQENELEQLDEIGKKEYVEYLKWLQRVKERSEKGLKTPPIVFTSDKLAEIISNYMETTIFSNRYGMFVREMSLVYLISQFEDFLQRNLEQFFKTKPNSLTSNEKTMTYDEIIKTKNHDELIDFIAYKETRKIIKQDIEEVSKTLLKRFKLNLLKNKDWNKFKERFYRRNVVIHNHCYPDREYRKKTGYKGDEVRLSIDQPYISDSIKLFEKYSNTVHRLFSNKIKKS